MEQRIERKRRPLLQIECLISRPGHRIAGQRAEMLPQRLQLQLERIHPYGHRRLLRQSGEDPLRPFRAKAFTQSVDKFRRKHYLCIRNLQQS